MTAQIAEPDALFDPADHVRSVIAGYRVRLAAVGAKLATYADDIRNRRGAADSGHAAARKLAGAEKFLSGEYDGTYAGPHPSFGVTLADYRVHYADDCLRTALHYLAWAEYDAGLITRAAAVAAGPHCR